MDLEMFHKAQRGIDFVLRPDKYSVPCFISPQCRLTGGFAGRAGAREDRLPVGGRSPESTVGRPGSHPIGS